MTLEVTGLCAGYGRAAILDGVSLSVAAGEVLLLLGRNGAGKSTTLKAIMGVLRPAAGSVRLGDEELAGREPYRIARAGIGWVPEDRRVFSELTMDENLEAGRGPPRDGLSPWTPDKLFKLFPNLATVRGRQGSRMSGGEQQMLAIARTLMGQSARAPARRACRRPCSDHRRSSCRGDLGLQARGLGRAACRTKHAIRASGRRQRHGLADRTGGVDRQDGRVLLGQSCANAAPCDLTSSTVLKRQAPMRLSELAWLSQGRSTTELWSTRPPEVRRTQAAEGSCLRAARGHAVEERA